MEYNEETIKMENLHPEKPCVYKIKALRKISISDQDEKCRNCEYPCQNYHPFKPNIEEPIRHGSLAFLIEQLKQ